MTEKILGKIANITFGTDDARLGLRIELSSGSTGVCDNTHVVWDPAHVDVGEYTKWTEPERSHEMELIMRFISKILHEANVTDITKLKGIPVEMEIENNSLKEWRILTEVL